MAAPRRTADRVYEDDRVNAELRMTNAEGEEGLRKVMSTNWSNREEVRRYMAQWRARNRAKIRVYQKTYFDKNKAEILLKKREYKRSNASLLKKQRADYYRRNREKCKATAARCHKARPEVSRAASQKWLAKQIAEISPAYAKVLLNTKGFKAAECSAELIQTTQALIRLKREIRNVYQQPV